MRISESVTRVKTDGSPYIPVEKTNVLFSVSWAITRSNPAPEVLMLMNGRSVVLPPPTPPSRDNVAITNSPCTKHQSTSGATPTHLAETPQLLHSLNIQQRYKTRGSSDFQHSNKTGKSFLSLVLISSAGRQHPSFQMPTVSNREGHRFITS